MMYFFDATGRCVASTSATYDNPKFPEALERFKQSMNATYNAEIAGGEYKLKDVYYDIAAGTAQKTLPSPVVLTGMQLTNVPIPAKLTINDTTYDTNDAVVDLEFTYSGTYKLKVTAFPYEDANFTKVVP